MKYKVFKFFFDFEKEENWVNQMASRGMNYVSYSPLGKYYFEEGIPGEYIYRFELLEEIPSSPANISYIKFMEETGAECVSTYMRWAVFRKKASQGAFNLYSDYDSKIKHYERIVKLLGWVWFLNLSAAILNVTLGLIMGEKYGVYFNLFISVISWSIVIIFIPILVSYSRRMNKLKKDKQIYG